MKRPAAHGRASAQKRPAALAAAARGKKRRPAKVAVQRKPARSATSFGQPVDPVIFAALSESDKVKVGPGRLHERDVSWRRAKKMKHRYGQDCHTDLMLFEQAVRRVFASLEDNYKDGKWKKTKKWKIKRYDVLEDELDEESDDLEMHGYTRQDIKDTVSVTAEYSAASQVLLLCRFLHSMFEMLNMPDYGDYHNTRHDAPEDWILKEVCRAMQKPLRAATDADFARAASKELLADAVGVFLFSARPDRHDRAWAKPYCKQLLEKLPVTIPAGWHPHTTLLLSSALNFGGLPDNHMCWR
eukprot:TRINITY_DN12819_c0_g1_i1.p1 TRINITY_DN12819_c0_g1~~TRINITY_DN12819_c0_g1_i1.p1  ORF type:complete len:325 (-),score=54.34 TRINITY_DN12819_c0_g1_i1:46-942(-)